MSKEKYFVHKPYKGILITTFFMSFDDIKGVEKFIKEEGLDVSGLRIFKGKEIKMKFVVEEEEDENND